ncbi:MAG TPA: hypothetical protein VLB04_09050 [Methanotrichaceae archaeon]|nr:hypothetical protein [Methanotrichaceae archaeon]
MEDVGDLIGKGFKTWKSNLNLCVPFLLNLLFSVMAVVPLVAALLAVLGSSGDLQSLDSATPEELLSRVEGSLFVLAATFVLVILAIALISAFFTAGAIGMAREALDTGKSTAGAMWSAGREHFLNMFIATLLMGIIVVAGAAFLLPGVIYLLPSFDPSPETVGLLVAGIMLLIIYALVVSLLLAIAPYALVVDSLGAVDAIKASVGFFKQNKFDVFVLWLVVVAISTGLQMIGNSVSTGDTVTFQPLSIVTGLVNLLVLAPLSTLWWTRLYMSRTGKLKEIEVKDPW